MPNGTLGVVNALFGLGGTIQNVLDRIRAEKERTEGTIEGIMIEVELNMILILGHYLETGAKAERVIKQLRMKNLTNAINAGFNFRQIRGGKIKKNMVGDVGFLKSYVDYDCGAFLKNIRFHIEQLKLLPELYDDIENVVGIDVKQRLTNLGKRYLLFTKFLIS